MRWPILIIVGTLVLAGTALGFIGRTFDPYQAGYPVKGLVLVLIFLVVSSLVTLVFHAIDTMRHRKIVSFGIDHGSLAVSFRRGALAGLLSVILIMIRRLNMFNPYSFFGAVLIMIIIEALLLKEYPHKDSIETT